MILPVATTYYQPVYIHQDSTSDTQKCLEKPEYADILQKTLQGEQLSEEDSQRITACVRDRQESESKVVVLVLIGIVILFVVMFVFGMVV